MFGVLTLAGLVVVVGSGVVLSMGGAAWWHTSSLGHFVNSVHLWSVELFFMAMVIHLWGKFWMAAWRGHRGLTWVTGVVAFDPISPAEGVRVHLEEGAGLVAVTTHARQGLRRLRFGATAADIVRISDAPVLLVPLAD